MNISHLLMSRNAYLIMGLSSDADEKLLNKRHKEMLNYIQIDEIPEYDNDISFVDYKKLRTEAMIKEAFLNLSNQKKKLYQTFFWFQLLDSKDEKCFKKFIQGEVNEVINEWDDLYETTRKYHYLKNGLIADLLLFEYQKQFREYGNFNQDAEQIVEALNELLYSEKFRAEFKEIFNLHNEIPLHTGVLNEFKKELPQYIAEAFFDLCEELKKPKLYKEYSETFGLNAKELDDNVEVMTAIKTIEQILKDIKAKDLADDLDDIIIGINEISEEVKKLDHLGLSDSPKMKKLKDDFASEVRSMAIKLYNDLNDPDNAMNFLEEAKVIAYSENIRSRILEDKKTLEKNILYQQGKRVQTNSQWEEEEVSRVSSAPTMYTINGIGTKIYGETLCFVVLFFPIFAISRRDVTNLGDWSYSFRGKKKLHKRQKIWNRTVLWIIIILVTTS